ncbi:MAG: helix-turn-helix transcriptional regulator [Negativicoccus succinicivorans]|uniref:helix-turn-helix domain-containing protein n=1 Tax=Negativicoccus succinicivorans TaxID=620903 RepID=UPI00096A6573|nr:helix-turn-helix transcriptional regulator [Negativicoccus succinicivorans]MBS5890726.1 helix-turn-helix transcriptional regulator [Negativicoccus succinicivorans]MDU2643717.1 helix-turn-helix transcriptional regulator [Negativicoccus succinicivorans]
MMYSKFHLNLRRLRHDYGLTQEEFGEILNLTKSQISLYEKGISRPNTDLLTRIAQYFNVPLTQLIETSIRHDFYFREVVTGRNITIQLPAEKGVENLIGVPGLIKIPEQADLRDIHSHNRDLLKYANFMLLYPKEKEDSAIASFFCEHFNGLGRQNIENLFRYNDWMEPIMPITYDGYPLLYQLLWVNRKGSWLNSTIAKPATNANILALALPQNNEIIRLYIRSEKYGCKLHATRCDGLEDLILDWIVKNKEERQAIAREYCLQIMKTETEAEDLGEEGGIGNDDSDEQDDLMPFIKKRGIERWID